jgi:tetratricopeptide (TPR) repeat protein
MASIISGNDTALCDSSGGSAAEGQECYICLSEPIVDPYVLPSCGHTFCFDCLSQWQGHMNNVFLAHGDVRDNSSSKLSCPACRVSSPNVEGTTTYDMPLLYAKRANKVGLTKTEINDFRNKALMELEKLQNTKHANTEAVALFTRAEILLELERPAEAEQDFVKLLQIHRHGIETRDTVNRMLAKGREVLTQGRDDEAKEIAQKCEEFRNENKSRAFHPNQVFDIYLGLAISFEKREQWDAAMDIYDIIAKIMKRTDNDAARHIIQMLIGTSRCAYHVGNYESSIKAGNAAIEVDRSWPGVHKYVALSQEAMGDIEASRVTISRAVNYEAPWDEKHKKDVLAMLEEMMASS